ncbi:hypothetical protein FGB62_1g6106 [Gracilaria domingensis]|nr:hypothetical protein FGB62_1g6106 [Gracilaria domingensis]
MHILESLRLARTHFEIEADGEPHTLDSLLTQFSTQPGSTALRVHRVSLLPSSEKEKLIFDTMAKHECHNSHRFPPQWLLKCFGSKHVKQSSVWAEAVPCRKSEHVSQREAIASKDKRGAEEETEMFQREGRIRWKKAKRLLSIHRLTEGCVPRLRSDISTVGGEERHEESTNQDYLLAPNKITIDVPRTKHAQDRTAASGDGTQYSNDPEFQKSSKSQDAAYFMNQEASSAEFEMIPVLAKDHDDTVRATERVYPAPDEIYTDSGASCIRECNSLCALGCQDGDEGTMKVMQLEGAETLMNKGPNGPDPEASIVRYEESILDRLSSATTGNENIHDEANDVPPKAYMEAGVHDELECLTPSTSKPSSAEGSSCNSSPLSVFSSAKVKAVQEEFSTSVGSKFETEQKISGDDAVSDGFHLQAVYDKALVPKLPPLDSGRFSGEHFQCESSENGSPFASEIENGRMSPILHNEGVQRFNREDEKEVNQVCDTNGKVPAELSCSQPAETRASCVKDGGITAKPMELNPETKAVKDPEILSCPQIQQLPYKRPDYSLDPEAKPDFIESLVAGNEMEATSGVLHLRRPGSSKSRNFQYPPSTRDYRLQRRIERFHRYFEEFLETERVVHDTAHRKSQVVNRVRRFFEDGSSDYVV